MLTLTVAMKEKAFFYHVFWDETCHRKLIGDSGFFMFEFESLERVDSTRSAPSATCV